MLIDTTFDVRTDAGGKDPDQHSGTLRRYHQLLWSKPLPSGVLFDLDDTVLGEYLVHRSALGEFFLASDAVIPTWQGWIQMESILAQVARHSHEAAMMATSANERLSAITAGSLPLRSRRAAGGR